MRLISYSRKGYVRLGALLERQVVDLQLAYQVYCRRGRMPADLDSCFASMKMLLSAGPDAIKLAHETVHFATRTLDQESIPGFWHRLDQVRLLAPLSNPGKLVCIGGNYPAAGKLSAPEFPTIFLKPASTITGPGMPVYVPAMASSVSYEVELAVVIGKRGYQVTETDATSYIAGYTLANDIGDRILEKRTSQWTSGKMFDSFTPLGPTIVTPDEVSDPRNLRMQTRVNEQQVQAGNTSEMFFDVNSLVRYVSTLTTLEPGDLILTGSPKLMDGQAAPVVSLKPGDTVLVGIDCLGELVNPLQEENI